MLIKNQKQITRYGSTGTSKLKKLSMSTQLENDPLESYNDAQFQHHLPKYYRSIIKDFKKTAASFVKFNFCFTSLIATEALFTFFLFSFFHNNSLSVALSLGTLILTGFTYLILLFYNQSKKPEEFKLLKEKFILSCRQLLPLPEGEAEHHLSIANALLKLSSYLEGFEWNFYKVPKLLHPLTKKINRFSAYVHSEDVFKMKEILLESAIEEHLKQIRITPTDLEVHASLANTYVSLSCVYKNLLKLPSEHPQKNKLEKFEAYFQERFTTFSEFAIEEFKILNYYAPNDPWVHEQLGQGYRDLEMPEEEIQEVEILLKLRPQDKETLYRLGTLCFQQGQNAKGLQVYEELKQSHYKKAENLISKYGEAVF